MLPCIIAKEHIIFQAKRKRPPPKPRDPPCNEDAWATPDNTEEAAVASPSKEWYKNRMHAVEEEKMNLKKKVKVLQQCKHRLQARNETAIEVIETIKERKLLSEEGDQVFSSTFSTDIQQLLSRATAEKKGKFPPALRTFALTLHFYSPAAYEYVCSKFMVPYHHNGHFASGIDPWMDVRDSQVKHSHFWRILCKLALKSSTAHSLWATRRYISMLSLSVTE